MLVGLPGSGKSSWASNHILNTPAMDFQIVSSDDIIEEKGFLEGLDYIASHEKNIVFAIGEMERKFSQYLKAGVNIIHDQTNLTVEIRKRHLAKVKGYMKSAVVFNVCKEELRHRLQRRKEKTGKDIPNFVIDKMSEYLQFPTKREGFDKIVTIEC